MISHCSVIFSGIIAAICWMWSKVYTYRMSLRMKSLWDVVYTAWIRNFLGELGERSAIHYPCSLQGGGQRRVRIGNHTSIASHGILGCWEQYHTMEADGSEVEQRFKPEIVIGDNCSIGKYTQITTINKITIGDGLLTGRYVYIGDNAHGGLSLEEAEIPPARRHLISKGGIKIGNNVWIGDKVSILGGVTIGDNVIIGAGSIVTHDIPSNSIAAGMPAKVVKELKI